MSHFDVSVQQVDGVCQVAIVGELDATTAPVLRERCADAHGHVIIDCSEMTFLDSSGIAELVILAKGVDSVVLTKPSPIVQRVIRLVGLTELLEMAD